MNWKLDWRVELGVMLLLISIVSYLLAYGVFQDVDKVLFYIMIDFAFVPVDVLIITLILEGIINKKKHESNPNRSKMMKRVVIAVGIILAILVLIGIGSYSEYHDYMSVENTKTITVNEKWIKAAPDSEKETYIVSDTNFNVYCVKDEPGLGLYDSSDRYAKLMPGDTYIIKTLGERSQQTSDYPNIVDVRLVKSNNTLN
ncbi:MAG: hypothetical protein LBM96_09095 [Methanobrevibacter sp.]|jgi:hypothetical protein|nr:hypothetical protein [Candidatus Methanoflexus mossambicus]